MHNFRGVTFNEKFQPKSCPISGTHMAAIISAGETGFTVLTEMVKHNVVVVVGGNPVSLHNQIVPVANLTYILRMWASWVGLLEVVTVIYPVPMAWEQITFSKQPS